MMWQNMLKDFYPKLVIIFLLLLPVSATEPTTGGPETIGNNPAESFQEDYRTDYSGPRDNVDGSGDFETWLNENFDGLEYGNPVYENGKLTALSFFSQGREIYKENYYYDKNGNPIMSQTVFFEGDNPHSLTGKVAVSDGAVAQVAYSNYFSEKENPVKDSTVIYYDTKSRETENYVFKNGLLKELKKTEYLSEGEYPSVETTDYFSDDSALVKKIICTRNSQGLTESETTEFPQENKKNTAFYTYSGSNDIRERIDLFYENNLQIKKVKVEYEYVSGTLSKEVRYEDETLVSETNYINDNEYEKIIYKDNRPVLKAIYSSGKKIQETIYKKDNKPQVRY